MAKLEPQRVFVQIYDGPSGVTVMVGVQWIVALREEKTPRESLDACRRMLAAICGLEIKDVEQAELAYVRMRETVKAEIARLRAEPQQADPS